jgi:hypothetical protein
MRNMTLGWPADHDRYGYKKLESAVHNRCPACPAVSIVHRQHGGTPAGQIDAKGVWVTSDAPNLSKMGEITHIFEIQMPHSSENSRPAINKPASFRQAKPSSSQYSKPTHKSSSSTKTNVLLSSAKIDFKCWVWEKTHYLTQCKEFLSMVPEIRQTTVRKLNLCFNCLSTKHTDSECNSGQCRHHTLLHTTPASSTANNESTKGTQSHTSQTSLSEWCKLSSICGNLYIWLTFITKIRINILHIFTIFNIFNIFHIVNAMKCKFTTKIFNCVKICLTVKNFNK